MRRALPGLLGAALAFSCLLPAAAQGDPRRGGPQGGRPPPWAGGLGGAARMIGDPLADLQKELGLSADQRDQINAIVGQALVSVVIDIGGTRRSGDLKGGLESLRSDEVGTIVSEVVKKIMDVLTPEQREKFAKGIEAFRARWQIPAGDEDPSPSPEQRVRRAMETLKIADAREEDAVKFLVSRVVKLQGDLEAFDQTAQEKAGEILKSEGITEETLEERLQSITAERKALEAQLRQMQEELASVVTARQELELYRQRIFR